MTQLEPEEARQGRKGTPVLKVLIAALALCVVAFIGLGFYGWQMPDANMPGTTEWVRGGECGAGNRAKPRFPGRAGAKQSAEMTPDKTADRIVADRRSRERPK